MKRVVTRKLSIRTIKRGSPEEIACIARIAAEKLNGRVS
jgi:hypothetical protein